MAESNDEPSQAKRQKLDLTTTIKVLVGKEKREYTLHKGFAIKSSEFFAKAVDGSWKEAMDQEVKLPEVDAADFERYLHWLYTGEISLDVEEDLVKQGKSMAIEHHKYAQSLSAYSLGHFLLDSAFRNATVDAVIDTNIDGNYLPDATVIASHWDKVPADSALVRLITRLWVVCISSASLGEEIPKLPTAFTTCLMKQFVEQRNSNGRLPTPSKQNRCEWHEHDDKAQRCS